jgi:hypothetical protein
MFCWQDPQNVGDGYAEEIQGHINGSYQAEATKAEA